MDEWCLGAGKQGAPRAFRFRFFVFVALFFAGSSLVAPAARAQIDPEKRQLVHLAYNQPIQGKGPLAVYGFYYRNQPNFLSNSNLTMRAAIAPLYLDAELGVSSL